MKKYGLLAIGILMICFSSCKKEKVIPTGGTLTLSSQIMGDPPDYFRYGFSFSAGDKHRYPGAQVDFLLFGIPDPGGSGNVVGAFFGVPDTIHFTPTFNETAYYSDTAAAQNFYSTYSEVTTTQFIYSTDNLITGQILTCRTKENKYAKMLIRDVRYITQGNESYAEVDITWQFQPNGSKKF
jgi:hypothetical protein